MRALVNSVTYWDVVCLNKIFGLDGKKLVSIAVPWISHSGNGYYYPALPLVLFFFDPETAFRFLLAGLAAFALELPPNASAVYPDTAQLIADWIENGHREDIGSLSREAWAQTGLVPRWDGR